MTLRTRLVTAAALVLAVLIAAGVLLPQIVRSSLVDQVDAQLSASRPVVVGVTLGFRPPTTPTRTPATVLSDLYVARIVSRNRQVVVHSASAPKREPRLPNDLSSTQHPFTVGSVRGGGSWRAEIVALPDGAQGLVALPLDRVDATSRRVVFAEVIATAAVVLAMTVAGWWLLRLGLRPIAEVTDVADAIARGDRARRVTEGASRTEAAHLARAFNVMLEEQQATEARLRQFVADASHELRSPVAAIGGLTDLWRQGAFEDRELEDVMRRIGQASVRMRGLVEDLLLLARLDEGRILDNDPVDLSALVRDVAQDMSATHPSRPVSVETPGPVLVNGDAVRLRQAISNLVVNALVHTNPAATVAARVERQGDDALISVSDTGPGMSPDDAEHAFDRFWRADAARSHSGSGLGLSIVRSVVEAHKGRADLTSTPGVGTTVRIVLPSYDAFMSAQPGANQQETPNRSS